MSPQLLPLSCKAEVKETDQPPCLVCSIDEQAGFLHETVCQSYVQN
jgi:hypothetical protein